MTSGKSLLYFLGTVNIFYSFVVTRSEAALLRDGYLRGDRGDIPSCDLLSFMFFDQ